MDEADVFEVFFGDKPVFLRGHCVFNDIPAISYLVFMIREIRT